MQNFLILEISVEKGEKNSLEESPFFQGGSINFKGIPELNLEGFYFWPPL